MKRVWTLYRVSTKSQVNVDEDIPMQRQSCREFVKSHSNWEITNELFERGISGWKKSTDDRDELVKIKEAAVKNEFDILLVFMYDRLGRREDETPLVVDFLHKNNVEVWSVKEGKRNMEQHVDKLINYISFWQSSGESIKTSIRVKETMKQIAEQGFYTGGRPPFGYEIYDTDRKHWKKDKVIKDIRINEYESSIVSTIFDLVINKEYGSGRIAKYLNEHGYKNRDDKMFRSNSINRILRNTVYTGRKRYGTTDSEGKIIDKSKWKTQPYREDLRIITDEDFNKVQKIIDSRSSKNNKNENENIVIKSNTLLAGFVYCKYCDSKLKSDYAYKKYTRKTDGLTTKTVSYRYRCNNARNVNNHPKSQWGAKQYEKIVIDQVIATMRMLDLNKFVDVTRNKKEDERKMMELHLKEIKKDYEKSNKSLTKLNEEITNALIGESDFTPKQLSQAIEKTEEKIEKLKGKIDEIELELIEDNKDISEINSLVNDLNDWEDKFKRADFERKKVLLSKVIDTIYLGKDEIELKLRNNIEKALNPVK